MAGGRPTKYLPEYCEQVIAMFKKGMSRCEIALNLDVDADTLLNWEKSYPEFLGAMKKGSYFSQGIWEGKGRKNLKSKDFNATLWIMNMKNRFRHDWGDKTIIEQTTTHKLHDNDLAELDEVKKAYKRDL
jgi:hypothetical protein